LVVESCISNTTCYGRGRPCLSAKVCPSAQACLAASNWFLCHSGIPTSGNLDQHDRRPRERIDTSYRELPSMAAAALVSPGGPYHSHHSSFSSSYPHSAPPTGMPGMISPVDSRRASDESENAHRQSLPSISEVIEAAKQQQSFGPSSAPLPMPQNLASPFSTSGPPRPFADAVSESNISPRSLHPTSGYPRADTLPGFSDPARPALASRPGPPPLLNAFQGQHPSPPIKHEQQYESDHQRHTEEQMYPGHQHQSSQSSLYTPPARPAGQLPLPPYPPVSPRHNGSALPSPFESQRTPTFTDERESSQSQELGEYRSTIDKAFESWGYLELLNVVSPASSQPTNEMGS
jgi:hypothetical protein